MKTLDFNAKLEQKRHAEMLEEGKQEMLKLLQSATDSEKKELFEALAAKDKVRFQQVSRPIIVRNCMWELNVKGEDK